EGLALALGPPIGRTFPTQVIDSRHLAAVIPALDLPPTEAERRVEARLQHLDGRTVEGAALGMGLGNDGGFPTPLGPARGQDRRRLYVASPTTDEVWVYDRGGRPSRGGAAPAPVTKIAVGDGPTAIGLLRSPRPGGATAEELVVAHQFAEELRLIETDPP